MLSTHPARSRSLVASREGTPVQKGWAGMARRRLCSHSHLKRKGRATAVSMEPSRRSQGDEGRKRKLEASNRKGSPVGSDDMDFKALLDQHINSTLQARLDGQAESQAQEVNELREKCEVLEARCSSLERSIQVLRKDVNWTYSAPDIPRSHWIEQGHDEEYADNMEDNIGRIKQDAMRIRNGVYIYCRCLDYEGQLTISHDDALLPHFKELADAIQLRNHALERLTWSDNWIPSDELADLLIKSIIENRVIKRIWLENSFNQSGVNGCRALAALMTCGRPFDLLNFRGNGLSGIDDVAAALATNPQLERLLIRDNQLNDRDADLIAQALKQNTNLQELELDGNNITSNGFEKMSTAIYDPSSLSAVESCNHTCSVDRVEGNEYVMTPRQRRNRKLYQLLSTRHVESSNARHLNAELGEEKHIIKLVPKVLHCIQCYSSDRMADSSMPLSITFELIKTWMMPELFEH
ncbi:hypothetical protein THAOC_16848 [Thalassiosira oceanica]|uniref:Uncharacterized protein n=1 Tax=Thalassiosira oceanica TaxID=159749 RepID=K0S8P2_THAOC|nr:hypothetical protein THAOC_16848 [Thalassiosira oceanica]|eukprot:EJK62538.1 hypothetical protein THAOC_16848 [Thalassiosira oceanica]